MVVSLLVGPSYAEDGEGIFITGDASGWVDVTVHQATTIRESDITIKSGGRYAGFYMAPDTATRHPVGALSIPSVGAGGESGGRLIRLGADYDVYPGTYRLYLLAEGPTDVFIPIAGQAFRGVRPRSAVSTRLAPMSFVVPASSSADERRVSMRVRSKSLTVAAQEVRSAGLTGVDYLRTCVVAAGNPCESSVVPAARPPAVAARSSVATVAQPGVYDAVFGTERGAGIHEDTQVTATTFVLTLQPAYNGV